MFDDCYRRIIEFERWVLESEAMEEEDVSKSVAITACTAMALFYVAILYAPTLILRLPPPTSFKSFLIRRFVCAAVSSVVSLIFSGLILPLIWSLVESMANPLAFHYIYVIGFLCFCIWSLKYCFVGISSFLSVDSPIILKLDKLLIRSWDPSYLCGIYGIRLDHMLQAVVYPVSLTSLIYAGSLVLKSVSLLDSLKEHWTDGEGHLSSFINNTFQILIGKFFSFASNIMAWRNYFVAPLTEELVFRACMIPLLLCGGFKTYSVIFFCPVFFSLAHLNHFLEFYAQENRSLAKAFMAVGLQLGYTVIFGSYASFLFIRTGHLIAPLVAHIFCNFMGLPVLYSRRNGIVSLAFIAGMVGFLWLLFPATHPHLYNDGTDNCRCWQRYCTWN